MDSFCTAYQRVIRAPGDGGSAKKLTPALQRRLAANEVLYRCRCENWSNPVCGKK